MTAATSQPTATSQHSTIVRLEPSGNQISMTDKQIYDRYTNTDLGVEIVNKNELNAKLFAKFNKAYGLAITGHDLDQAIALLPVENQIIMRDSMAIVDITTGLDMCQERLLWSLKASIRDQDY